MIFEYLRFFVEKNMEPFIFRPAPMKYWEILKMVKTKSHSLPTIPEDLLHVSSPNRIAPYLNSVNAPAYSWPRQSSQIPWSESPACQIWSYRTNPPGQGLASDVYQINRRSSRGGFRNMPQRRQRHQSKSCATCPWKIPNSFKGFLRLTRAKTLAEYRLIIDSFGAYWSVHFFEKIVFPLWFWWYRTMLDNIGKHATAHYGSEDCRFPSTSLRMVSIVEP